MYKITGFVWVNLDIWNLAFAFEIWAYGDSKHKWGSGGLLYMGSSGVFQGTREGSWVVIYVWVVVIFKLDIWSVVWGKVNESLISGMRIGS